MIKLTASTENKQDEKQEMRLKLPEEMRLLQNSLSLPNVLFPVSASSFFWGGMVPMRLVKAGSRVERSLHGALVGWWPEWAAPQYSHLMVPGAGLLLEEEQQIWVEKAGFPNSDVYRTTCYSKQKETSLKCTYYVSWMCLSKGYSHIQMFYIFIHTAASLTGAE